MIPEKDFIYISKKQASIATAVITCVCLFMFVLGYFWGKQSIINDFSQRVAQESENDQADYLLTMQSFSELDKSKNQRDSHSEQSDKETIKEDGIDDHKSDKEVVLQEGKKPTQAVAQREKYPHYATLASFGTSNAAASFVARLKKHNISVDVKTRRSKSSSGKITKTWYQVLTKSYKTKDEVQKIVDKIQKVEKLKANNIKIY